MTVRAPITPSSDTAASMPDGAGARLDRIQAAIASLIAEERRLARLGLAEAERRCRRQRRYWEFLAAVFSLEPEPAPNGPRGGGATIDWDAVFRFGDGTR